MCVDLPDRCGGRSRSESKIWRGLAVMLDSDGPTEDFFGYPNRTLLDATEKIRYASSEEAAASEAKHSNSELGGGRREFMI